MYNKVLRVARGSARYARSQGGMDCNYRQIDVICRWSNVLRANRRLANAKSSMLQENKRDAACMYTHILLFIRNLIGTNLDFSLCRGDCAAVSCCALLCSRFNDILRTCSYILRYCCLLLHTYRSRMFVAVQKTMGNERQQWKIKTVAA